MITSEDLQKTRLYFSELEDALCHYSSCLPQGRFHTITVRTNTEGKPGLELVSKTRMPCLDDLPGHIKNLRYAAEQLDKLSPAFWEKVYTDHLNGRRENFPYVPMQITVWGTGNHKQNIFMRHADLYAKLLGDFSWSRSEPPDHCRDNAEQCFRIIDAYLKFSGYINEVNSVLPLCQIKEAAP
jgi:hypothetical protein